MPRRIRRPVFLLVLYSDRAARQTVGHTLPTCLGAADDFGEELRADLAVEGSPVSPQPCKQADLLADAQAQAKQVASAAGVSSGPILSIGSVGSLHSPHQLWCPQGMHLRTLAL
jgi:hypothetical protein